MLPTMMNRTDTFQQTLDEVLAAHRDLVGDAAPGATLRPSSAASAVDISLGLGPFEETLGEGGMGVVRTARQRALNRTVAVKSLRGNTPSQAATRHLLHEAMAAGVLDHPNILPIYDIVVDAEGQPHILMKRVEGRPWSSWAHNPAAIRRDLGENDPLAWNLGVLISVCNAIAYAHDRGILHRDLKLDNVMIGAFGEVLVLDWGIAVALDERYGHRLALARDQRKLAGTPSHMAPELALAQGARQGPATDIYLIGAMLYHLLAGRPPHQGRTVEEVLASIPKVRPKLGDQVPGALARIVERALAFEPQDRYPDVLSLRDEVRAFLEHRASVRVARQAGQSLSDLQAAIEQGSTDKATLYRYFDQARFGFKQALSDWPQNPLAQGGLRSARLALARWEVDREQPGAAQTLIEPLDDPPADLVEQIRALQQEQEARQAELAGLRAERDPSIGQRTRTFVISLVGLTWITAPILYGFYRPIESLWVVFGSSMVPLILVLILGIWARDSLSRTALNRASWLTMMLIPIAQLILDTMLLSMGAEPEIALQLRPAIWACVAIMFCALILPTVLPATVLFVLVALTAPLWPEILPWTATVANVALVGQLLWIWLRPREW